MNKLLTVYKFHVKEAIKAKSTKISMVIMFAAVLAFFGFSHWSSSQDAISKDEVGVINLSTHYSLDLQSINKQLSTTKLIEKEKSAEKKLRDEVKNEDLSGLLLISEQNNRPIVTAINNRAGANGEEVSLVTQQLQKKYVATIVKENKVNEKVASNLLTPIAVKNEVVKEDHHEKTVGIVYAFVFLMYLFILSYGQMIATAVASEKSSRVMEIMIPKVKPLYMMYGKIAAILTVACIQFATIFIGGLVAYAVGWLNPDQLSLFGLGIDLSALTPRIIISFVVYFALGYIIYAMMYATVGSMVSRIEDLGSAVLPVIMLIMGAFFIGMNSLFAPNSTLVVISSYIPFFSPIATFSRIVAGEAGWIETGITIGILLITIVCINFVASRIYVNGVMRYGGKIKIKDMIQMAKNQ
ncbi:hypothetical protein A374_07754 [Fictibacillus macauensis ZFHKF-1]|uniref:ABC-2 type transporter transmembrane domain-containing protein n=1 Tax=Fictibacillus macauensis ZFHKF-1 TaxID=1196324 RepID=I8AIX1_9BACL|nr:ABC transporter permease [Fictibacillus macauensis]EIT85712.1 hypothetical protein A374_07754 [Fictibacillus macauensis ZFHKF-1]